MRGDAGQLRDAAQREVAAANDGHIPVDEQLGVADRAVAQPAHHEVALAGHVEKLGLRPSGEDQRPRIVCLTLARHDVIAPVDSGDRLDVVEAPCKVQVFDLTCEAADDLIAVDDHVALDERELQVVIRLAAKIARDEQGIQPFLDRVDGSGQPGRASADDDQVKH
jgi:hypothetical protein